MKKNSGVTRYVIISTLLALITSVIVALSFGRFFDITRDYAIHDGMSITAQTAGRIEDNINTGVEALSISVEAVRYMHVQNLSETSVQKYIMIQAESLINSTDGMFTGMYICSDGVLFDGMGRDIPEGFVPTERVWYTEAMGNPGTVVMTGPYDDTANPGFQCVTFSSAIPNENAVIAVDFLIDDIQAIVENTTINGSGFCLIVNRNGGIVAHQDRSIIGQNVYEFGSEDMTDLGKEIKANKSRQYFIKKELNGTLYYMFLNHISDKWYMMLAITAHDLFAPLMRSLYIYILISLLVYGGIIAYGVNSVRVKEREEDARHKAERLSAELSEALNEAKSASIAKSRFLFNMSHDIRTPMNAISGFVNLAYSHADNPEDVRRYLEKAKGSEEYLLGMISDVLDMSRIESGNVTISETAVDLRVKTESLIEIIRQAAIKKHIDVQFDIRGVHEPIVYIDETHCGRIAVNVLGNAVKYTPEGGSVRFAITQKPSAKEGYVYTVFEARDNGIGMSNEFLEHIYETFSRENNTTISKIEGTGLGMSIVKSLIDLMGGKINVASVPGEGTTVSVELDLKVAPQTEVVHAVNSDETRIRRKIEGMHVLLVEDNELNREIAGEILRERGVIVDEAADGSEAVSIIMAAAPGYYDLVLMDVQMPVMNGYEATKAIRDLDNSESASVPIVAMTANAFDEDKKQAADAGMNGHLPKPINVTELEEALVKYAKSEASFTNP